MPSFACVFVLVVANQAFWALAVNAKHSGRIVRSVGADGTVAEADAAALNEMIEQPEMGDKVQGVLREFQDLARTGTSPNPDKISVIKGIVTDELLPDLQATHDSAAKQVKANLAAIDQCNENALARLQEIKGTTEVSVGQERTEHASCREAEKEKTSTKGDKCKELDDFLKGINVPADLPAGRPRDQMVQYVKTMSDYFCPKGPTVTTLNDACNKATEEHAKHKAACDKLQAAFELGFCTWRTELSDACAALSTCYESATKLYNDHVSATKELVKKWKVEYAALKKILCYVEVWLKDKNVKTADADQLKKCETSSIDTSPMDIDFGTPAAQAQCSLTAVENYPGTPGFVTTEYANFNDYVNEVIPCLGNGQTTVAPTTVAPIEVKWEFFEDAACSKGDWAILTLKSGTELSGCMEWLVRDTESTGHKTYPIYSKATCEGGGLSKEIYFSDPQCKVYSKANTRLPGFTVDSSNYAKEQAGECFAMSLTHQGEHKAHRYSKIHGVGQLTFPNCEGSFLEGEAKETKSKPLLAMAGKMSLFGSDTA